MTETETEQTQKNIEIQDSDRDALHILPLSILPIETIALRHTRLIKNAQLEGVVELFEGSKTGSGQVEVDDIV